MSGDALRALLLEALRDEATPAERIKALAAAACTTTTTTTTTAPLTSLRDHLDLIIPSRADDDGSKTILALAASNKVRSRGVQLEALSLVVACLERQRTVWAMATTDRVHRNFEPWSKNLAGSLEQGHRLGCQGLRQAAHDDVLAGKWLDFARALIKATPYDRLEDGLEAELVQCLLQSRRGLALVALAQYVAKVEPAREEQEARGAHSKVLTALDALRDVTRLSQDEQNMVWELLASPNALARVDAHFVELAIRSVLLREAEQSPTRPRPRLCHALTFLQGFAERHPRSQLETYARLFGHDLVTCLPFQLLALIAVLPLPLGEDRVQKSLEAESEEERASAVRAFGIRLVPNVSNLDRLVDFCRDPSERVRSKATWTLANLGERHDLTRYRTEVLAMAHDTSLARIGAIRILGQQFTDDEALDSLVPLLESEGRPKVLWNVCVALTNMVKSKRTTRRDRLAQLSLALSTAEGGNFKVRIQALELFLSATDASASELERLARSALAALALEARVIPFREQAHLSKLRARWRAVEGSEASENSGEITDCR